MLFGFDEILKDAAVQAAIKEAVKDATRTDFLTTLTTVALGSIAAVAAIATAAFPVIRMVLKGIRELKADLGNNTELTKKGVAKVEEIKSDTLEAKESAQSAKKDAIVAVGVAKTAKDAATDAKAIATDRQETLLAKMDTVIENVNGKLDRNVSLAHEAGVAKGQRDLLADLANSHGERIIALETRVGKIEETVKDGFDKVLNRISEVGT